MPRLARVVATGNPHHITQRGNRKQQTFFNDSDYNAYLEIMREWCDKCGVEIWAYCLMPNHIHLIAVPESEDALRRAIGEAHRRYTRRINLREDWRGHLWQGRFSSFIMDKPHLLTAARYIELNPVRAGIVKQPEHWKWSSAAAHLSNRDDRLAKAAPLINLVFENWRDFLSQPIADTAADQLRHHERTGRPLGDSSFITLLEEHLNRPLTPQKAGRKKKSDK